MSTPILQTAFCCTNNNAFRSTHLFTAALALFCLLIVVSNTLGQERSEVEQINFSFGNYLGTGFYASGGGEVFILRIPLTTTLRPMTSNNSGWILNCPVTLGVAIWT